MTVPCPPWVTAAAAWRSTCECGAERPTATLGGAVIAPGSSAGPVVTTARTGSVPSRYQSTGNMAALAPPPYRTASGDILSMRHRRVMSQDTFHSPPEPGSRAPSNHATPEDNAVAVSISMV